jgi:hypothetical protein
MDMAVANATISGGGLTWTRQTYTPNSEEIFYSTGLVIWTAPVTTGASMTITINSNETSCQRIRICPFAYTDYVSVGEAKAATSTNADGAFSYNLNAAPSVASEILSAISTTNAGSGSVFVDPGSEWTEEHEYGEDGLFSMQVQSRRGSKSAAISWADLVGTGSTDTRWADKGYAAAVVINLTPQVEFANANAIVEGTDLAGGDGTLSVAPPSKLSEGNLWVVTVGIDNDPGATISMPAGWSAIHTLVSGADNGYPTQRSFYKIAGAGETAVNVTVENVYQHWAVSQRYIGVDQTTPIGNVATTNPTTSQSTLDAPDITIGANKSMAVLTEAHHATSASATTITIPSGTTEIMARGASTKYAQGAIAYQARDSGSFAPGNWTLSAARTNRSGITFEIKPYNEGGTSLVSNDLSASYNIGGIVFNDLSPSYSIIGGLTSVMTDRGRVVGRGIGRGMR